MNPNDTIDAVIFLSQKVANPLEDTLEGIKSAWGAGVGAVKGANTLNDLKDRAVGFWNHNHDRIVRDAQWAGGGAALGGLSSLMTSYRRPGESEEDYRSRRFRETVSSVLGGAALGGGAREGMDYINGTNALHDPAGAADLAAGARRKFDPAGPGGGQDRPHIPSSPELAAQKNEGAAIESDPARGGRFLRQQWEKLHPGQEPTDDEIRAMATGDGISQDALSHVTDPVTNHPKWPTGPFGGKVDGSLVGGAAGASYWGIKDSLNPPSFPITGDNTASDLVRKARAVAGPEVQATHFLKHPATGVTLLDAMGNPVTAPTFDNKGLPVKTTGPSAINLGHNSDVLTAADNFDAANVGLESAISGRKWYHKLPLPFVPDNGVRAARGAAADALGQFQQTVSSTAPKPLPQLPGTPAGTPPAMTTNADTFSSVSDGLKKVMRVSPATDNSGVVMNDLDKMNHEGSGLLTRKGVAPKVGLPRTASTFGRAGRLTKNIGIGAGLGFGAGWLADQQNAAGVKESDAAFEARRLAEAAAR